MYRQIVLLCLLAVQACWVNGAPAEKGDLPQPRSQLKLIDKHIVGGEYVSIEAVPYQAILELFWMNTCGAAIIGPNWLVTAGHCIFEIDSITKFTSWVRVGSTTSILFGWGGKVHFIEKMLAHPKYDMSTTDYDLGLIQVTTAIEMNDRAKAVPLPLPTQGDDFIDYKQNATASGWGATSEDGIFLPIYLKKVDVPLVPHDECVEVYKNTIDSKDVTSRMLCAGGYARGDACMGDSGGPLAHKGTLIGVISWGNGCNVLPGVYASLLNTELRTFVSEQSGL